MRSPIASFPASPRRPNQVTFRRPVSSSISAHTTGTRPRNSETRTMRPTAISSLDSAAAESRARANAPRRISAIGVGERQSL
jgi:hypothetical protein